MTGAASQSRYGYNNQTNPLFRNMPNPTAQSRYGYDKQNDSPLFRKMSNPSTQSQTPPPDMRNMATSSAPFSGSQTTSQYPTTQAQYQRFMGTTSQSSHDYDNQMSSRLFCNPSNATAQSQTQSPDMRKVATSSSGNSGTSQYPTSQAQYQGSTGRTP